MRNTFLKKTEKRLSFGRSMIEMLGVLAIIGVLSIGGLYAYRQAMNRYRTNQLIEFYNKIYFATCEACFNTDTCPLVENNTVENREFFCHSILGDEYCLPSLMQGWAQLPFLKTAMWMFYFRSSRTTYFGLNSVPQAICVDFMKRFWGEKLTAVSVGILGESAETVDVNGTLSDENRKDLVAMCQKNEESLMTFTWKIR